MTEQERIHRNQVLLEKNLTEYIFKKNYSSNEAQAFLEGIQFVSNWTEAYKNVLQKVTNDGRKNE